MATPIDQKIVDLLLADTATTALVGDRITPADLTPETDLPCIVVNISSDEPNENYLDGPNTLTDYSVDVDVYALTYKVMRDICNAVKPVLHLYSDIDTPRLVYRNGNSEPFENGKQYKQTYFAVHRDT
jgi:hypothetical protein